ncbi:hypothetical protein WT13_05400 [Burkholderia anthina]|nr:hypothetical protein WT13_05400 [Burkholderia anthina]
MFRENVGSLAVWTSLNERSFDLSHDTLRNRIEFGVIKQVQICDEGLGGTNSIHYLRENVSADVGQIQITQFHQPRCYLVTIQSKFSEFRNQ